MLQYYCKWLTLKQKKLQLSSKLFRNKIYIFIKIVFKVVIITLEADHWLLRRQFQVFKQHKFYYKLLFAPSKHIVELRLQTAIQTCTLVEQPYFSY